MLNIESGQNELLRVFGLDAAGNRTAIPDGATVVYSAVTDISGTGAGVLTPTSGLEAQLLAGPVGDAGEIIATVTLPDGTTLTTPAFDFTDVAGPLASIEIEVVPQ
jgi:hypothetical protein